MSSDLPVDGDGVCMKCKSTPPEAENLLCRTCATPWHAQCLSKPPETLASVADWLCPDCSGLASGSAAGVEGVAGVVGSDDLVSKIRAIEADASLDEKEKARRRQALVSGKAHDKVDDEGKKAEADGNVFELMDESFKCSICMQLPERPVSTPCGHNFCLKCFEKWIKQGKNQCANCRAAIPQRLASQPRINSALVTAIRMARTAKAATAGHGKVYHFVHNENKPDKAFTTDWAKKAGKANASSGRIFVTVPPDHFGPILDVNDPRERGVLVGDTWEDRFECRQWGAHLPHVAGIAGQSQYGAQSVALSGGYEDDEDHGEWFLYTGSGGRDLSGNKRTNKEQSSDQKFVKGNEALRVSCLKGYPVRVVRSSKEKRSSYAPENGVRYDGIYRIEKCWRKPGIQGFKVCRYLFVRCDNEPAPWTSDEHGDRPRPLPVIKELKDATDLTVREESPSWDYDVQKGDWTWMKPPPASRKPVQSGEPNGQQRIRKAIKFAHEVSVKERLLKEFSCSICHQVMTSPMSTPCGHNFCMACLHGFYADKSFVRERVSAGGRKLRTRKIVKKCPLCPTDISDFLQNPQVNRQLMALIESLQRKSEEQELAVKGEDGDDDSTEASDEENDLNEDGIGADMDEVGEGNGKEVADSLRPKAYSLDEKKLEISTDNLMARADHFDDDSAPKKEVKDNADSPPCKRRKTAAAGTEDVASYKEAESPSSPLAVSANDDGIE